MSRSTVTRVGSTVLAALWALSACAGVSSSSEDTFVAGIDGRNDIQVRVVNSNFYDARIYVIGDGVRRQLGTVGGKTDGVFRMDWTHSQDLRMQINLLAGPTCTTESITVDPGDILQLQIMPDSNRSDFCR